MKVKELGGSSWFVIGVLVVSHILLAFASGF